LNKFLYISVVKFLEYPGGVLPGRAGQVLD